MTEGQGQPDGATRRGTAIRLGLVGQGIGRSRTPAMHRAEGAAQGLDLTYELLDTDLMEPARRSLPGILDAAEREGFAGLNVTFPYKKEAMGLLDTLSDAARRVGAVNTVVFRDGRRSGHNTDFHGFAEGLRRGLPDAGKGSVLLLGAGGAGGAVAHALLGEGVARLLVADRSPEAAAALVRDLDALSPGAALHAPDLAAAAATVDGIVNATPMGMAKLPGTAIPAELLEPRHWVADIVYFPLETELLREARARGCRTVSGAGMAVFQAVRAFELFTGLTADPDRMQATFMAFDETAA